MIQSRIPIAAILLVAAFPALPQEAIFVVRHAEKQTESNDPPTPLSEAGAARARRLAEMLKEAGITAILSTDMVRTRSTAEPLARLRGISTEIYAANNAQGAVDPEILVRTLRDRHAKDVVLVVGHGNTVGPLLSALGCPGEVKIGSAEYDNLFVVVPRVGRPPELLRLKY